MTAELAVALPILLSVTIGLVWLLGVGTAQVRLVDAAREVARASARGESFDAAVQVGQRVGGPAVAITVAQRDGLVVVTATDDVQGPGGLFDFLPSVRLHAEAVAAVEPGA